MEYKTKPRLLTLKLKQMKKRFASYSVLIIALTAFFGCTKKDWSSDYDVQFPLPVISGFSPASARVGDTIVISGTTLGNIDNAWINDQGAKIVSGSDSQLKVVIGIGSKTGSIKVRNVYRQVGLSANAINVIP